MNEKEVPEEEKQHVWEPPGTHEERPKRELAHPGMQRSPPRLAQRCQSVSALLRPPVPSPLSHVLPRPWEMEGSPHNTLHQSILGGGTTLSLGPGFPKTPQQPPRSLDYLWVTRTKPGDPSDLLGLSKEAPSCLHHPQPSQAKPSPPPTPSHENAGMGVWEAFMGYRSG